MSLLITLIAIVATIALCIHFIFNIIKRYSFTAENLTALVTISVLSFTLLIIGGVSIVNAYVAHTQMLTAQAHIKACSQLTRDAKVLCLNPLLQAAAQPASVQEMKICEGMPPHSDAAVACFNSLSQKTALLESE